MTDMRYELIMVQPHVCCLSYGRRHHKLLQWNSCVVYILSANLRLLSLLRQILLSQITLICEDGVVCRGIANLVHVLAQISRHVRLLLLCSSSIASTACLYLNSDGRWSLCRALVRLNRLQRLILILQVVRLDLLGAKLWPDAES